MGVLLEKLVALVIELKLHLDWRRIQEDAAASAQPWMLMR